jgi:chaperonin GroEL (HSP60 family)
MSETKSESALRKNIEAATMIVRTVRSTLGPLGRDKMMVDAGGNTIVTNDGATILRELDVTHPGGKMVIECAQTQANLCYDGTTTTVVLAGELLNNSENLINRGLHPNIVSHGYNEAADMATKYLVESLSKDAKLPYVDSSGIDTHYLKKIARTAITGKTVDAALDTVADLCVQAVEKAGSAEKVRVLSLPGGTLRDSYLFNGAIVNKFYVIERELETVQQIILLNNGLEPQKTEENVTVQLDMQGYSQFKSSSNDDLLEQAKIIIQHLPEGGVVFIRDGAVDHVCAYLHKHNVSVVRRLPESTMRALSSTLGLPIAQTPSDIECAAKGSVHTERHYDVNYVFVQGAIDSDQSTLVLRGATTTTLDEIERGFDDALGVVSLVMNGDGIVAGGGSSYAAMAAHLRSQAASVEGRAQMAIEAFADSLEIIPATIAENGGQDPLDCILNLRHKLQNGDIDFGPDLEDGGIVSMWKIGVVEPTSLVRQAILSATEVTTAILKIDDMVAKRGE